jgi:hypothetical protein
MRLNTIIGLITLAGLAIGPEAEAREAISTTFGISLELVSTECPGCGGGPLLATAFGWANEQYIGPEGASQTLIASLVDVTAIACDDVGVGIASESSCLVGFGSEVQSPGSNATLATTMTSSICYTCISPVSITTESAIARAQLILTNGVPCDITVLPTFHLQLNNTPCTSLAPTSYGVHRSIAIIRHNGSTVWTGLMVNSANGSSISNLTDEGGGEFAADIDEIALSGSLDIYTAGFADRTHDANGDGRFNNADAAEVDTWVGETGVPSAILAAADLNDNGSIEQDEVDTLQILLDAGGGTGSFGDLDDDSDTDCTDFANGDSAWGDSLGDAGYRFELDYNLDGNLGEDDRAAFYRTVGHADFNLDGFVDFFDFDEYVDAFENDLPAAEWNLDGFLDFFDYEAFVAAFEEGC